MLRIAGSNGICGMLCHMLVAVTGNSSLAVDMGRGDCLYKDCEPGISRSINRWVSSGVLEKVGHGEFKR